jgi:hypothetical protein
MKKLLQYLLYIILLSTVTAAFSFYFAENTYHILVAEDGIFENITAVVLLTISILFSIRLIKTGKTRNKFWIVLNILIVAGAFFGFGEEISWGQRIFSIETGEFFAKNNLQGETNLHNLQIGNIKINKLFFSQGMVVIFGSYFVLALILYKRWFRFQKLTDLFGIQIPKLKHTILMLAVTGVILIVPDLRIWELWETAFVVILLIVFVDPYNKNEELLHY